MPRSFADALFGGEGAAVASPVSHYSSSTPSKSHHYNRHHEGSVAGNTAEMTEYGGMDSSSSSSSSGSSSYQKQQRSRQAHSTAGTGTTNYQTPLTTNYKPKKNLWEAMREKKLRSGGKNFMEAMTKRINDPSSRPVTQSFSTTYNGVAGNSLAAALGVPVEIATFNEPAEAVARKTPGKDIDSTMKDWWKDSYNSSGVVRSGGGKKKNLWEMITGPDTEGTKYVFGAGASKAKPYHTTTPVKRSTAPSQAQKSYSEDAKYGSTQKQLFSTQPPAKVVPAPAPAPTYRPPVPAPVPASPAYQVPAPEPAVSNNYSSSNSDMLELKRMMQTLMRDVQGTRDTVQSLQQSVQQLDHRLTKLENAQGTSVSAQPVVAAPPSMSMAPAPTMVAPPAPAQQQYRQQRQQDYSSSEDSDSSGSDYSDESSSSEDPDDSQNDQARAATALFAKFRA